MEPRILITAGLLAISAGLSAPLASAGEPKAEPSAMDRAGEVISDTALTAKIKAQLLAEDHLSAMDIGVETSQGVVTLTGAVDEPAQVDLATEVVQDIDGVRDVHNELVARAD